MLVSEQIYVVSKESDVLLFFIITHLAIHYIIPLKLKAQFVCTYNFYLCRELKCVVVNVEYRLAPEHKFPAMFDDGKAVVRWVLMNKSLVGKSVSSVSDLL